MYVSCIKKIKINFCFRPIYVKLRLNTNKAVEMERNSF